MGNNNNNNLEKLLMTYKQLVDSYESGVSLAQIENMIEEDYTINARNIDAETYIKNEEDYIIVQSALTFLKLNIHYYEDYNKNISNYLDKYLQKCYNQRKEFDQILNDGVSFDNLKAMVDYDTKLFDRNIFFDESNQTVTKSNNDKMIKKITLQMMEKENN